MRIEVEMETHLYTIFEALDVRINDFHASFTSKDGTHLSEDVFPLLCDCAVP